MILRRVRWLEKNFPFKISALILWATWGFILSWCKRLCQLPVASFELLDLNNFWIKFFLNVQSKNWIETNDNCLEVIKSFCSTTIRDLMLFIKSNKHSMILNGKFFSTQHILQTLRSLIITYSGWCNTLCSRKYIK